MLRCPILRLTGANSGKNETPKLGEGEEEMLIGSSTTSACSLLLSVGSTKKIGYRFRSTVKADNRGTHALLLSFLFLEHFWNLFCRCIEIEEPPLEMEDENINHKEVGDLKTGVEGASFQLGAEGHGMLCLVLSWFCAPTRLLEPTASSLRFGILGSIFNIDISDFFPLLCIA